MSNNLESELDDYSNDLNTLGNQELADMSIKEARTHGVQITRTNGVYKANFSVYDYRKNLGIYDEKAGLHGDASQQNLCIKIINELRSKLTTYQNR